MQIEGSLRDDKFNKSVQIDIQESIDRMEKLIKDAELIDETSNDSPKSKRQPLRKPPKSQDNSDSSKVIHYDNPNSDEWALLPRSRRREITQVWAANLPVIWKRRLEAYFRSVNADDSESPKKVKK